MNPENSRTVAITVSRDKLARAMMRFDQLAHTVSATISVLTQEKHELEVRLKEISALLDQERSLAKQREKLFSSNKSEAEQHQAERTELRSKLSELNSIALSQSDAIARLEQELTSKSELLAAQLENDDQRRSKSATLTSEIAELEKSIDSITAERDLLREQLHAQQKDATRWALKLSREEMKAASKAFDLIEKKLESVEQKILNAQPTAEKPEPDIFEQA